MTRFLHTSDWQLGMPGLFLDAGIRERYSHDRFACVRTLGGIARDEGCAFIVVCGDVFDSNMLSRKIVGKALEALLSVPVPIYLLPGNHDPLNDASIYLRRDFLDDKPAHVHVVVDATPVMTDAGIEIVGAPWTAKRLAANPLHDVLDHLGPAAAPRLILAHGAVDGMGDFSDSPATISRARMQKALDDGVAHFFALGDKHSITRIDAAGRIWYSGTPEVTASREPDPGFVNIVDLDADGAACRRVRTGKWRFAEMERSDLENGGDVEDLLRTLRDIPDKEHCALTLTLAGVLTLGDTDALLRGLKVVGERFASFKESHDGLHAGVDVDDFDDGRLGGFAAEAALELKNRAEAGGADAVAARNALLLLLRLLASRSEEAP